MKKQRTLKIGQIHEDMILSPESMDALLWAVDALQLSRVDRGIVASIRRAYADGVVPEDEQAEMDVDRLIQILESYAPAYTFVGSRTSNTEEFGVWPQWWAIEGDPYVHRSANVPGEDAEETRKARKACGYWLHVNDRGNCTLYRRAGNRWIEEWSAV